MNHELEKTADEEHVQADTTRVCQPRSPGHEEPSTSDSDNDDILNLDEEDDFGACEYKWRLIDLTADQIRRLAGQMDHRLEHGDRQCWYNIGVLDDGFALGMTKKELDESMSNLSTIAEEVGAHICFKSLQPVIYQCAKTVEELRNILLYHRHARREGSMFTAEDKRRLVRKLTNNSFPKIELFVIKAMIRRKFGPLDYERYHVALIGNVDAGKSTLVGVLTKGIKDNGSGLARAGVFLHAHEGVHGQTSSESVQLMGYNPEGALVNATTDSHGKLSWPEIIRLSKRVVLWHDLAGHERYLKTTLGGLIANAPEHVLLVVSASDGIRGTVREHLYAVLSLKIPLAIVVTKIDVTPASKIAKTTDRIIALFKKKKHTSAQVVKTLDDAMRCAELTTGQNIVPIFQVSSVTKEGYGPFEAFWNMVPIRNPMASNAGGPVEFRIFKEYVNKGVGLIVYGKLLSGTVRVGQKVLIGPFSDNVYREVPIRSIQVHRIDVDHATAGDEVCLAIPKLLQGSVTRGNIKAGMYVVDPALVTKSTAELNAEQAFYDKERSVQSGMISKLQAQLDSKGVDERQKCSLRNRIRHCGEVLHSIPTTANKWRCCWEFLVDLQIAKSISRKGDSNQKSGHAKVGYQPVAHIGSMKQTVCFLSFESIDSKNKNSAKQRRTIDCMQPGDRARVWLRLLHRPAWFRVQDRLILREGNTRGKGVILEISPVRHMAVKVKQKPLRIRPSRLRLGSTESSSTKPSIKATSKPVGKPSAKTSAKPSVKSALPPAPPTKTAAQPPKPPTE